MPPSCMDYEIFLFFEIAISLNNTVVFHFYFEQFPVGQVATKYTCLSVELMERHIITSVY